MLLTIRPIRAIILTMIFSKTTLEKKVKRAISDLPRWLFKLHSGKKVFGKQKDLLIADILALGGMNLLESECGIIFKKYSRVSRVKVSLKKLKNIRRKLLKEQEYAIQMLRTY